MLSNELFMLCTSPEDSIQACEPRLSFREASLAPKIRWFEFCNFALKAIPLSGGKVGQPTISFIDSGRLEQDS
jgi:hypothetical protein